MANILATNDDGVKSLLWSKLCDALEAAGHTVYGIAPEKDQSWIATAHTLGRELPLTEIAPRRWRLEGTPADCVGVAPLVIQGKIDVVVSGINIGVNTRLPMILASGTVGAATMGAMMGLRAIAFSYAMPREFFAERKRNGGIVAQTAVATEAMLAYCVQRVCQLLSEKEIVFGRVYNVNFPAVVTPDTQCQKAPVAITPLESTFEKLSNGSFKQCNPKFGKLMNDGENEFTVIGAGKISESILDWAGINAPTPVSSI